MRAEELCARAEHSSGEIRQKLYRWGVGEDDRDAIIESLERRRFVDDARFAAAFVRDRVEYAGWGRHKIALALYQKRVDRDIIDAALDEVDMEHYRERLQELMERKCRSMAAPESYESRTKLYRWAVSRGFEPELVAAAIRNC